MDWRYKLYFNEIYWKGYMWNPTPQALNVELHSFKNSEHYNGGEVDVDIKSL